MSKVIIHRHAAKYLKRLPKDTRQRIKNILLELKQNPGGQPGVRQMVVEWDGYYRIRAGKLRIIYWFDEKQDVVYVDHIGPRGDVYK